MGKGTIGSLISQCRFTERMAELILQKESYELIGLCMEVHRQLGPGFSEAIYKEALEIELQEHNIAYEREKVFRVDYKGHSL
jgi:PD-(D/E)XK nuclease superfamily